MWARGRHPPGALVTPLRTQKAAQPNTQEEEAGAVEKQARDMSLGPSPSCKRLPGYSRTQRLSTNAVSTVFEEPGMCPGGSTSLANLPLVDKLLCVSPGRAGGPAGRPSPSSAHGGARSHNPYPSGPRLMQLPTVIYRCTTFAMASWVGKKPSVSQQG